jgi:DnaK suppressor protein
MLDKLLQLKLELESVADDGRDSSKIVELDQSRLGRLSRMDAMQAQAMSQASDQRRELTLRRIAAAIDRVESGAYGVCQSCDEDIPRKRLEFDPAALLCIGCASEAESQ